MAEAAPTGVGDAGRRCYQPRLGSDEGACDQSARYVARLNWTFGPMQLCEEHAIEERALGDVIEIRSLKEERSV